MSKDLEGWLIKQIKVPEKKITQVYNGVDLNRFKCHETKPWLLLPIEFRVPGLLLIGTVGRLDPVKDQTTLVQAFIHLVKVNPALSSQVRLIIVGDGVLLSALQALVLDANVENLVWFAGERHDVADIMQALDLFVLPSINEGISNTILEAMASSLPVIATKVGGNPELVVDGHTGYLVAKQDPIAMAAAFKRYLLQPELLMLHGQAGRARVVSTFSLNRMMADYSAIYDKLLAERVLN
jgi:sugar transferase (PEP-CTERM/EpsH1 system associated)